MSVTSLHPARSVLESSAAGRFPQVDGRIEAMPPDARGTWAIVEFTGHALVLSDRPSGDASVGLRRCRPISSSSILIEP